MDEQQEIISRPPSHPIATTLLIVSMLGTILAIAFVWMELFGEYLPTPQPGGPQIDPKHNSRAIAENHRKEHYKVDFPGDDVMADIEKDLGISNSVGDGLGN